MSDEPLVSVSLITYNHAPFIEQAIESVLAQKTNFPFEVLIGEDESRDGTREIVQRYAAAHPEVIRLHLHSRSSNIQYGGRPTGRHNFVNNLKCARGKYITPLDGDDYWTTPNKLQLQCDHLEKHPEIAICFGRSEFIDEKGAPLDIPSNIPTGESTFTLADFLQHRFFPRMGSVMFRRGLFGDFPEWYYRCPVGDFPLHVLNAQHGNFGLIDQVLVAYRIHPGGLWSQGLTPAEWSASNPAQQQRIAERWGAFIDLYEHLDNHLGRNYRGIVRKKIAEFARSQAGAFQLLGDWRNVRRSTWRAWRAEPFSTGQRLRSTLRLLLRSYRETSRR